MLGGLARRAAFDEKIRSEKNSVLIVDSGDLFFDPRSGEPSDQKLTKARLIGRAYRHLGASAVNVGDFDLTQGLDFLREQSSQGLPLISSNLLDSSTKKPIFPPYRIQETSGVRIAFFGLLSPVFPPDIENQSKAHNEGKILIKDPVESARETVQQLQGKADLIVLLSDLGTMKDQAVARAVPGIQFILGGHEGRFARRPEQVGRTYLLQSAAKGMYVGRLKIHLENSSSPFKYEGEAQSIQERINTLDSQIRSLQAARQQGGQNAVHLDRTIQAMNRERNSLQDQLQKAKEAPLQGNRFEFTLQGLEANLPEDGEVRKWISDAGLQKD